VDLDVEAERRLQSRREQLHLLRLGKSTRARQAGFKALLVLVDRSSALAGRQLAERIRSQRRPEAQIEELGEAAPWWCALLALDLHVPQLRGVLEVVGRHPDLLLLGDALLVEEGFTPIDEREGVGLPVEAGKVHLLEPGWPIAVVFARAGGGA
jgi:hypothetical protein